MLVVEGVDDADFSGGAGFDGVVGWEGGVGGGAAGGGVRPFVGGGAVLLVGGVEGGGGPAGGVVVEVEDWECGDISYLILGGSAEREKEYQVACCRNATLAAKARPARNRRGLGDTPGLRHQGRACSRSRDRKTSTPATES